MKWVTETSMAWGIDVIKSTSCVPYRSHPCKYRKAEFVQCWTKIMFIIITHRNLPSHEHPLLGTSPRLPGQHSEREEWRGGLLRMQEEFSEEKLNTASFPIN